MPKIDFNAIDDVNDFSPLPEGRYLCRVVSVDERTTRQGDDLWGLRLMVEEGEHSGRYIFDNLVFTPRAMPRVKLVCTHLGVNTNGEVDLQPEHLLEKTCVVSVMIEDYEDETGQTKKRNRVPFAGYETADSAAGEDDGEDVPF